MTGWHFVLAGVLSGIIDAVFYAGEIVKQSFGEALGDYTVQVTSEIGFLSPLVNSVLQGAVYLILLTRPKGLKHSFNRLHLIWIVGVSVVTPWVTWAIAQKNGIPLDARLMVNAGIHVLIGLAGGAIYASS